MVVPNQLLEREGELLLGLERDEPGRLGRFDRRQVELASQRHPARQPHAHAIGLGFMAGQKRFDRFGDQLMFLGLIGGVAQRLGMFHQRGGFDPCLLLRVIPAELDGLQSARAEVEAPGRPRAAGPHQPGGAAEHAPLFGGQEIDPHRGLLQSGQGQAAGNGKAAGKSPDVRFAQERFREIRR